MQVNIKTLSHPPLEIFDELPPNFGGPRLSGGETVSAIGSFGEMCIQEFHCADFTVRYSVIETKELLKLESQSFHSGLHSLIMMRNSLRPDVEHAPELTIGENQFTIMNGHRPKSILTFPANQHYICFETMISTEFAKGLTNDFPGLPEVIQLPAPHQTNILVNPAKWADHEVMEQIYYLLGYRYQEEYRKAYFSNRVKDICWKLLFLHFENEVLISPQEEKDIEKVNYVMRLIMDNLDEHLLVKYLAQKAVINESQLKKSFKKETGMGIHEFRIYERLKVAMRLLKNGSTVKEAALQTGWRPADLIKAFYKTYGTTPGTIKKKRNS